MIKLKDLHMKLTVRAALEYVGSGKGFAELRDRFNELCKDWYADEYDPDDLSLDVSDIARHIEDEPWIKDIAAMPVHKRTWQMNVRVVEEYIARYWAVKKEEITSKNVADVLLVADPLSRRHIMAQRVVIESIHGIRNGAELHRLDDVMSAIATNPRLEK